MFFLPVDFPASATIYLLDKMADIEHRLSLGANEKLQLSSLIAAFNTAKRKVESEGKKQAEAS